MILFKQKMLHFKIKNAETFILYIIMMVARTMNQTTAAAPN